MSGTPRSPKNRLTKPSTMPRRRVDGDADLNFQVDVPTRGYFSPGDLVAGRVVRNAHVVATRAWVTVRLWGRTKVLMRVRRRNDTSIYRARHNFWGQETEKTIFDGPMHIPAGGQPLVLPFAVTIPTRANPQQVAWDNKPEAAFTSLNADAVRAAPLPPSFNATGSHIASSVSYFECYVEYYLEAHLNKEESGSGSILRRTPHATIPIRVLAPSSASPVTDFGLQRRAFFDTFRTSRLVPGLEDIEPSFREKARSFFHSSKTPHMGVQMRVQVPRRLQQCHPSPFPFLMQAVRDPGRTSPDVAGTPQRVTLVSLSLALQSHVEVVVPTTFGKRKAGSPKTLLLGPAKNHALREPVVLPVVDLDAAEVPPPVDVGAKLGLALDAHGRFSFAGQVWELGRGGSASARVLAPSFETFSMRQSFELHWDMRMVCAGETARFQGLESVIVMAPSQQHAAPPLQGVMPQLYPPATPPPEFETFSDREDVENRGKAGEVENPEKDEAAPPYSP